MAMKAKPTTRRATPRQTAQDKFTGLTGTWKAVAQFGLSGVVAATMMYAVLYLQPQQLKEFMQATEKQRESGFSHGEKIADNLTTGIKDLASKVEKVGEKFGSVQSVTQGKQADIIGRIDRTNELLERQIIGDGPAASIASPPMPLPEWVPLRPKTK